MKTVKTCGCADCRKVSATENQVKLAAKLYAARDSVKFIMGDKYKERIKDYVESLKTIAHSTGRSEMAIAGEAAQDAAKDNAMMALIFLAAGVEALEPTP